MLKKCLHGKTQNANESFNGTITNRVPKSTHVGLNVLSSGVYDAIAHFNYGEKLHWNSWRSTQEFIWSTNAMPNREYPTQT